jgi:Transposase DDE domain
MRNDLLLKQRALSVVEQLRGRIIDPGLCSRHRRRLQDFSREYRLTFPVLVMLLLQKSLKSLQARLHELVRQLAPGAEGSPLSAGAVTHARAKLSAGVFVELNRQAVLPTVYAQENKELVRRWHGHRVLAVDSSVVRLPKNQAVAKKYGWMECSNEGVSAERYPLGRISVLYDVLNEMALDASLAAWKVGEEALAHAHLDWVESGDIVLTDRGYTSYLWVLDVLARGAHFVSRCSGSSFAPAQSLLKLDRAGVSVWATMKVDKHVKAECLKRGWPLEVTVRFVTVRLKTGQLEVLVTSLLDENVYRTQEFADLYWRRWGQETFYGRLKGRLDLENCSGTTLDAVEQDFAATVLLSNVESVVIGPAAAELAEHTHDRKQPAKINRAVSIHALKTRLIDLLASTLPAEQVLAELTRWFQDNPVSVRKRRKVPRLQPSNARSYHYQRYVRKIVF